MTRNSAVKTRRRRSRRSSRAFPDNTSNFGDKERCVGCDAAFPNDARFCDQCGCRRKWKTGERKLASDAVSNETNADTVALQRDASDRDRSSAQDSSQDAPGGSWYWGTEHLLLHTPALNKDAVVSSQDKRESKYFAKEHEARLLKQQRGLKPLTPISSSCSSNNNQSARSAQRSQRKGPAGEMQVGTPSAQTPESAEQVLHLPPIGAYSQQIQSQSLREASHSNCTDVGKFDCHKVANPEKKISAATKCALWGLCLDEAVASFQATEIILVAEIGADERCMSFLKQQVQLSHQQNQQKHPGEFASKPRKRSPRLTQLEIKLVALEKKLFMNKQKLVSVRQRLEELRSSGDANRLANNNSVDERTCYDDPGDSATVGHVIDDSGLNLPTQGESSHATKTSRKKKKRKKSKRRSEPELDDGIISSLHAVLTIQRAFRKFIQASRWKYAAAAASVTTNKSQPGSSRANRSHKNTLTSLDAYAAPSSLSLEAAAVRIQSLYHRRAGRAVLRHLLAEVYEKGFDPDSNSFYYYSKRTKQSQWEKPVLLGDHDLADLSKSAQDNIEKPEPSDPSCQERHQAAQAIQRLYRNRATRLFLRDLATGTLQKVFDADFGAWYYFNHRTQQSFWEKPQHAQLTTAREISTTSEHSPSTEDELQAAP